ncbi:hypothetical protein [Streptomyces sp. 6-11-2]|uniref:hypothetical protein n=1 Tax=Streptomyces sp. 6-11-2 TaxID=2585753 RepID=UPI0011413DDE|nr:hypothetical protein [Streptomyces sp. 6-11-2]
MSDQTRKIYDDIRHRQVLSHPHADDGHTTGAVGTYLDSGKSVAFRPKGDSAAQKRSAPSGIRSRLAAIAAVPSTTSTGRQTSMRRCTASWITSHSRPTKKRFGPTVYTVGITPGWL